MINSQKLTVVIEPSTTKRRKGEGTYGHKNHRP